jgi:drug/metabolite transporter (DMT)-like permease
VFATYLLMPLVLILLRFDVRTIKPQLLPKAAGAGILSLVAYGVVLWATHYVDVGIVSALRETSVLWAILISLMFLKETFTWPRIISAVMISGGVALIVRTN